MSGKFQKRTKKVNSRNRIAIIVQHLQPTMALTEIAKSFKCFLPDKKCIASLCKRAEKSNLFYPCIVTVINLFKKLKSNTEMIKYKIFKIYFCMFCWNFINLK